MKKEITTNDDVQLLVSEFYKSLLQHEDIHPAFVGINVEDHMPRMVAFWSFVLLDEIGYTANVFEKHIHLDLKEGMFDTWLKTFENTVNRFFVGEKAELAIQRANVIAYTFREKLKAMNKLG